MKIKLRDVDQFKTLLLTNGLTQRGYGRAIGISEPYANQIANGTRNPGPAIAKKTTELLNVEFQDIFFIEDACNSNRSDKQEVI
ncbi:helix-turn-helix domain-containing protein [Virgibacillus halodenitrificans]|uniref:helix-turn-helix domain-containing protein n=1 Tax=Virgibacillus halodenitrificans TaxID=1482 RepID=UPI00136A2175